MNTILKTSRLSSCVGIHDDMTFQFRVLLIRSHWSRCRECRYLSFVCRSAFTKWPTNCFRASFDGLHEWANHRSVASRQYSFVLVYRAEFVVKLHFVHSFTESIGGIRPVITIGDWNLNPGLRPPRRRGLLGRRVRLRDLVPQLNLLLRLLRLSPLPSVDSVRLLLALSSRSE